ncbi:MAG: porin [Thermoanaerobaculia bacterium]|jgi:phosphate-selective porin OprO/OprP
MKSIARILTVVFALALLVNPAFAQEPTDTDKRINELEKKIEQLMKDKAEEEKLPEQKLASGAEAERTMEPVALRSFYDNGYLVWASKDGEFKYWLDGRLNLDAAVYDGSENRLHDGVEARRARIGVKATLFGDWLTEIDVDFADNAVEIKDLWAGYAGFDNSLIKFGNHKAPFGLENLSSSKYIVFIERGYIDAWVPDRRIGLNYSYWGENWQASAGVYGQPAGEFNDKDTYTGGGAGTDQPLNWVGRFSYAPLNESGRILHFGIAGALMHPDISKLPTSGADLYDREDAAKIVKFDSRSESHVSRAKFLSTGDMKYVDSYELLGLEAAGVFGAFTFQGEYQTASVNRSETTVAKVVDHDFSGYYGYVTWFITGETRPYYSSEGEFGRVMPKSKAGAWEVALRYSNFDLNDITSVDAIKGGSADNITAALNWYINPNHKIMFDVTAVNNDEYAKPGKDFAPIPPGNSTAQVPVYGDDFTIFAVRYQVAF